MKYLFAKLAQAGGEAPGVRFYAVFTILQVLATVIGLHLTWNSNALPLVWPTAGVLYAALLVAHPRSWIAIAGLGILVEVATAQFFHGSLETSHDLMRSAADVGITACQAIFASWIVRRLGRAWRDRQSPVNDFVIGLVAAAFSAAAGSVASVVTSLLIDGVAARWPSMVVWWSADFFAMAILAPALVPMLRTPRPSANGHTVSLEFAREFLEFTLAVLCIALFVVLLLNGAFGDDANLSVLDTILIPVLPWPPLLWLAFRNPPHWVALANAVAAVLIAGTLHEARGLLQVDSYSPFEVAVSLQFVMCATAIVTLAVATVLSDRRQRGREMRREIDFEQLLRSLSSKVQATHAGALDQTINDGLAQVGQLTGASRCSLIYVNDVSSRFDTSHSWQANHVPARDLDDPLLSPEHFSQVAGRLASGEVVESLLGDTLTNRQPARRVAPGSGLEQSVTLVPVSAGEVTACLALHGWTSTAGTRSVQWLLVLLTQLFVNALEWRDAKDANERHQHRLRVLANETLHADERARRQTAAHLHDGVGQHLAVLRIQIAKMVERGADHRQLVEAQRLVTESIHAARDLLKDLSPSVLHELGLASAFTWLSEKLSRDHDVPVLFEAEDNLPEATAPMRGMMFQAGRELCMNAVKHAQASRIELRLAAADDGSTLVLTVRDDGVGFDPQSPAPADSTSGFGLLSVRERLTGDGGALEIESALGIGTCASVCVPLRAS